MLKLLLGYENVLSRLVPTGSFGSKVFFKSIFSSEKLVSYQKKPIGYFAFRRRKQPGKASAPADFRRNSSHTENSKKGRYRAKTG